MFEFHKITQSRKVQAYHRQPKLAAREFPDFISILCLLEKGLCPLYERILDLTGSRNTNHLESFSTAS